jgi:hypothetical protein
LCSEPMRRKKIEWDVGWDGFGKMKHFPMCVCEGMGVIYRKGVHSEGKFTGIGGKKGQKMKITNRKYIINERGRKNCPKYYRGT